jgi:hypothetical protein
LFAKRDLVPSSLASKVESDYVTRSIRDLREN